MSQGLWLLLMFTCGALLAAIYLGALWLTVQRISDCRHPALWLLASLLARMVLVVATFYWILGDGHWQRLLAALAGFVTLRIVILGRVRRIAASGSAREKIA
jgi:F1F0 ATPase subunit 2